MASARSTPGSFGLSRGVTSLHVTAETLNSVPGGSVRAVARAGYVSAGGEALKVAALVALAVAVLLKGAPHVAVVVACLAIAAVRGARRSFRIGQRFARGAASEEVVGAQLEALEDSRWVVEHDLVKPGGGNIDHVVHSASRTFVIDTKRSQWRAKDIAQACRHADWAARHFGSRRLIVPVICIERSDQQPMLIDGIWVVGRPHLVALIEEEG
jgi:hypothetical protein